MEQTIKDEVVFTISTMILNLIQPDFKDKEEKNESRRSKN